MREGMLVSFIILCDHNQIIILCKRDSFGFHRVCEAFSTMVRESMLQVHSIFIQNQLPEPLSQPFGDFSIHTFEKQLPKKGVLRCSYKYFSLFR